MMLLLVIYTFLNKNYSFKPISFLERLKFVLYMFFLSFFNTKTFEKLDLSQVGYLKFSTINAKQLLSTIVLIVCIKRLGSNSILIWLWT